MTNPPLARLLRPEATVMAACNSAVVGWSGMTRSAVSSSNDLHSGNFARIDGRAPEHSVHITSEGIEDVVEIIPGSQRIEQSGIVSPYHDLVVPIRHFYHTPLVVIFYYTTYSWVMDL